MDKKKDPKKTRDEDNEELIRRMRNGDSLTSYDSFSSWFPPRPTIKKDKKTIEKLYTRKTTATKNKEKENDSDTKPPSESENAEKKHLKVVE